MAAAAAGAMIDQLSDLQLTFLWIEKSQMMQTLSANQKEIIKGTGYQYLSYLAKFQGKGKNLSEQYTASANIGENIFNRLKSQEIPNLPANWDLTDKAKEVASVLGLNG